MRLLRFCVLLLCISFILYRPSLSHAANPYKTDYAVEYFLDDAGNSLQTKVMFSVVITNLKSDVFVKKFTLSFPKSFEISNIEAVDDLGSVKPVVIPDEKKLNIELEFTNPKTGRDTINTFKLSFSQTNLFTISGNVWEVMLPTVENKNYTSYKAIVHLPQNTNKKISISKPKPTKIENNTITWINPPTRTIYAVFGESQLYGFQMQYHLKNPKLRPVYIDIAMPPDTLYQKILIERIDPSPSLFYIDDDGNYMGRYYLNPTESKNISLDMIVQVYSVLREEFIPVSKSMFANQQKYLLNDESYWKLSPAPKTNLLTSAYEIYNFVTTKLTYNYSRVSNNITRLGAQAIMAKPDLAVCTEFSDLFIALTREKGIYSREIEGYGFSHDTQMRPISLISDVLHSWPEYYDQKNGIWVSIDPTWENTSGIDYFSSFDLNHVVFAIHGKKANYPYPAGMYKIENSKDITVNLLSAAPPDKKEVRIESPQLVKRINDKTTYKSFFTIINAGNVYAYAIPISITGEQIHISPQNMVINSLAPFEKKKIAFEYKISTENRKKEGSLQIAIYGNALYKNSFEIVSSSFETALTFNLVLLVAVTFFIILIFIRRTRRTNRIVQ